ncbi:hypothetical protein [Azospirillum argentinense]
MDERRCGQKDFTDFADLKHGLHGFFFDLAQQKRLEKSLLSKHQKKSV